MAIKAGQQEVAIYALTCPVTGRVRYVGKTCGSLERRLRGHLAEATRYPHLHKSRWIKSLTREGLRPEIVLLEWATEDTWQDAERRHIASHEGLTNAADGGAGCPSIGKSADHTRRVSEALRGRSFPHLQGEAQGNAKLTDDDVRTIRRLRAAGVQGIEVARQFGVTPQLVSLIHLGRAWAHVNNERECV